MARKPQETNRSAVTGEFVTKEEAAASPHTTVKEKHSPFDVRNASDLEKIIASAEEAASEVEALVNPTNIFATRYRDLIWASQELLRLFGERGHTGIPVIEEEQ